MTVTKKVLITGQDGRHHSTTANLTRILAEVRLDEVDTLRAQSDLAVSDEAPEDTADVDAIGTLRLLGDPSRARERLGCLAPLREPTIDPKAINPLPGLDPQADPAPQPPPAGSGHG
ncbi:MAG: GDP-mannose 4,6-dehydratase [Lamprobacter sp.]|uniref:GDP-mannose 4,6-dehydratase n=1 Tax=Lamprobacter sp. TaxID=3100796 RepID=UPI002B25A805|nr:GDP-mannose 4,6-dehydratase [Lamprobacter sp.]MEA3644192.1 GDP-mannose 4,6-dehydratase [Lamprobacter sp.]